MEKKLERIKLLSDELETHNHQLQRIQSQIASKLNEIKQLSTPSHAEVLTQGHGTGKSTKPMTVLGQLPSPMTTMIARSMSGFGRRRWEDDDRALSPKVEKQMSDQSSIMVHHEHHHKKQPDIQYYTRPQFLEEVLRRFNYMGKITNSVWIASFPYWRSYNKAVIRVGAPPSTVAKLYEFGLIHTVHPSKELTELNALPIEIKKYAMLLQATGAPGSQLFLRFYSSIPEYDEGVVPAQHIVKYGFTTDERLPKDYTTFSYKEEDLSEISTWRAKSLYGIMKGIGELLTDGKRYAVRTEDSLKSTIFVNQSTSWINMEIVAGLFTSFLEGDIPGTEETLIRFCRFSQKEAGHRCSFCRKKIEKSDTEQLKEVEPL